MQLASMGIGPAFRCKVALNNLDMEVNTKYHSIQKLILISLFDTKLMIRVSNRELNKKSNDSYNLP